MEYAAEEQRYAMEEQGELTGRLLEIAIDCAGQGVWDVQNKTKSVQVSPVWFKMRGLDENDREAASQERWLARVHEEDRESVQSDSGNV